METATYKVPFASSLSSFFSFYYPGNAYFLRNVSYTETHVIPFEFIDIQTLPALEKHTKQIRYIVCKVSQIADIAINART